MKGYIIEERYKGEVVLGVIDDAEKYNFCSYRGKKCVEVAWGGTHEGFGINRKTYKLSYNKKYESRGGRETKSRFAVKVHEAEPYPFVTITDLWEVED